MGRNSKKVSDRKIVSVGTKLDVPFYKRVEVCAEKMDLTISQVTRQAIREFIERWEESIAA